MTYISPGNRRMDIPTFSLPAGITCHNKTIYCDKYCYAKKAEKAYKNVLPSRIRNLNDSKREMFVNEVYNLLKNINIKYFRIHESGDFYSQTYLEKWFSICRLFPDIKFLAYTQMYHLDYSNKPNNLILYWTVWPDSRNVPKDGLKAYVVDDGKGKIPDYPVKPKGKNCSKGMGSKVKCENCKYCLEGKGDVIFKIH